MRLFIIAAITLDGFIARDEYHSSMSWTSKADKKRFVEITKKAGVVIVGSTTYKTFQRPLKDRLNIVYSRSEKFTSISDQVEITTVDPKKLIDDLESRGFKEAAVCGGSQIYTTFMKAGIVDTIYITIEPTIFGTGIHLFTEKIPHNLKLISSEITPEGTILLEYKVHYEKRT